MATVGSIVIGVSATTAGLSKNLRSASGQVQSFGEQIGGLGGLTKLAVGALAGFSVVEGIKTAVTAASDLNEQVSKSRQVFGDSSSVVEAAAQRMADAFGTPKTEFIDAASSLGLIAKGAGLSQQAAAQMGTQFAELGADVSSFYNVPLQEALGAIRSGLVGESEPLRRFGVLLNENAVKAEAVQMGIARMGATLTDAQKVQARSSLITRGLATAHGDLERTSDGVANRIRNLGGQFQNLAAEAGTALLPITTVFLNLASTLVSKVAPAIVPVASALSTGFLAVIDTVQPGLEAIGQRLLEMPAQVSGAFGETTLGYLAGFWTSIKTYVLDALNLVGIAWRNLPDFVDIAVLQISEGMMNVGAYIATIPANLAIVADYIANNWYQLITDAISAVGTAFSNLGTNIGELARSIYQFLSDPTQGFQFNWKPLLEGFQATAAELPTLVGPELVSFQDQIDEKIAAIGQRETARAQELADKAAAGAAPTVPTPAADQAALTPAPLAKAPKETTAAAVELGSKEAYSAIVKATAGGGDPMKSLDQTNKAQLGVQQQMAASLKKIEGKGSTPKVLSLTG